VLGGELRLASPHEEAPSRDNGTAPVNPLRPDEPAGLLLPGPLLVAVLAELLSPLVLVDLRFPALFQ
jgi:hypothetical protein